MKKIYMLLTLSVSLAVVGLCATTDNPQELLNSIETAIEQAVGAETPDQIPGYNFGDDHVTVNTGGIECPKEVSDVKQAADLLKAKLSSAFTNRIVSLRSHAFPPGDDTVIVAKVRDGAQEVAVSVTIFKRSSSRVILFPVMVSKAAE